MILSCFASSPSLLLKPLRDGWTDFLQEPSIPEISLRNPLSKGTVNHQRWPSSLKKSVTSSRKETKHYTKLGKDMIKRSPIGIVENVLVKIDKFLFPSDFVVMNTLNTRDETMIIGRPFLATIHAEIDVFNKEISLGIGGDRVTFNMDKKIHNFTTPIGEIYMINETSNTSSDASSRAEETNDVHNKNNSCNQEKDEVVRSQENLNLI
ncbi:putative reverse transcriptase domain-containing protein [Tanacetum coccineum]